MRRRWVLLLLLLAAVCAYGWLDVRRRARVDRGRRHHRTDFTVYQSAARALSDGTNPYLAENPRGYRYVYPPLLAVLLMPLAHWEPPDAALVFYALSVGALAAALSCLTRMVGWRATLAGTLFCIPFLHQSFQRGQVTILLLALQVGALSCCVRGRPFSAGLLLALGGALRLTPFLPAAALCAGALAAARPKPALRLGGGLATGVLLGFLVIPLVALGSDGTRQVNRQWVEQSGNLFAGKPGQLEALARVNEYRFKNQSPRRVIATWAGWLSGAGFERERPGLSTGAWRTVDLAAYALAAAFGLWALRLGWSRLRDPAGETFAPALAIVFMLPLFMTRYAWPTHYVMALPAVVLAHSHGGLAVFFAGTALFYLAHVGPLEPIGAAGPLLFGALLFVALHRRASLGRISPT
ncbi:MAG: glycosyltransferase family 87 protein [Planctomycetota bacterium]|nr:glycosyltransferase family 87 protein [Planctomycetota bacterium]